MFCCTKRGKAFRFHEAPQLADDEPACVRPSAVACPKISALWGHKSGNCALSPTDAFWGESGQATVEAAFLLPVLFFLIGLLLQPALLLYTRCVMNSASAETCRVAATATCGDEALEQFARRRLAAVPQLGVLHSRDCDWELSVVADPVQGSSSVAVEGHVKPLPLLGLMTGFVVMSADDGCLLLQASSSCELWPDWMQRVDGAPEDWISRWR